MRIAVQSALNIKALVQKQSAAVEPTAGLVPPGWPGEVSVAVPQTNINLGKTAVSLLPKSSRSLELLVRSGNPDNLAQAQLIAQQLKIVGLAVDIKQASTARYAIDLAAGSFDLALISLAPRVAVASDVTLQWSVTAGLGSGWPIDQTTASYAGQLSVPAFGADAQKAAQSFQSLVLEPIEAEALSARPHQALVGNRVQGLVVRLDGSLPLDRASVRN